MSNPLKYMCAECGNDTFDHGIFHDTNKEITFCSEKCKEIYLATEKYESLGDSYE